MQKRKDHVMSEENGKKPNKKITSVFPYLGAAALAFFVWYCCVTPKFLWVMRSTGRHYSVSRIIVTGIVVLLGLYVCFAKFDKEEKKEKKRGFYIFLFTPVVTFLMMEYASSAGPSMIWADLGYVCILRSIFSVMILLILLLILWAVTNSMFASGTLICVLVIVYDLANYFTYQFRGIPILASDLATVGTALNVVGNYEYQLGFYQLIMVVCMIEWIVLLARIKKTKFAATRKNHAKCAAAGAAVLAVCVCTALYTPIISDVASVYVSTYRPNKSYKKNGVILTFVRSIQLMFIEEPKGYSPEAAEKIAEPYRAADTSDREYQKPNVIAIMDEAFADLQAVGEFETSQEIMPFYNHLKENAVKGFTYVSVFGGQTANSEFEFLTGLSKAFLPEGATAYQLYIKNPLPNLTTALGKQDYQGLLAFHPYLENGYGRQRAYPNLGFRDFIGIDDIEHDESDKVRSFVSDAKDMQTIIEEYEKAKASSDAPFYLFNVTMQNHSGYSSIYENFEQPITIEEKYSSPEAEQYINLIHKSDEALEQLLDYFSKTDDPTVVVFFGDHEPRLPNEFYGKLLGKDINNLNMKENMELYKTPFLIWANYDIEEKEGVKISSNYLSTLMAEAAGMELTPMNRFLSDLYKEVPILTANGYYGSNGKLYPVQEKKSPYYEKIKEYQILQYNTLFDGEHRIEGFFD